MDFPIFPYILIVVGLLFLAAEIFLMTHGILTALALAGIITGIAMTFHENTPRGVVTLVVVILIIPILGPILIHYAPKTALGRRFILTGPEEDANTAAMPVNLELEELRGRYGKTVSVLRPSGTTDFDGRRVDATSEGSMIEAGQWVRCVDVKEGKVIVRQVEKPPNLEHLDPLDLTR